MNCVVTINVFLSVWFISLVSLFCVLISYYIVYYNID
ncbi:hypothetical protein Alsa1_CDS0161 [Staphylococcus phage Alsa_1]|nr:hypothetical protein Alsa1_CDS0161 [Staphylococcus phage Alsa_1]WNM50754.1 hypothetical protein Alsa2_CDS0140 [Staphylococcus phage Alsa_2]